MVLEKLIFYIKESLRHRHKSARSSWKQRTKMRGVNSALLRSHCKGGGAEETRTRTHTHGRTRTHPTNHTTHTHTHTYTHTQRTLATRTHNGFNMHTPCETHTHTQHAQILPTDFHIRGGRVPGYCHEACKVEGQSYYNTRLHEYKSKSP